jgi:1,4-dihydroxy-2-naphthoate octaprenyltransferase
VSPLILLLSVLVGITTSVILFCSHWHQIKGDLAAGKMSPLVRLGTAKACKVKLLIS